MASKEAPVEVSESAKKEAAKMAKAYDDRPTAVLPGAINEWLDEDGQPKYGKEGSEPSK